MRMIEQEFPLDIRICLSKFIDRYRSVTKEDNQLFANRAKEILKIVEEYPELEEGIATRERLEELRPQLKLVLEDAFSEVLQQNEIKIATAPFEHEIIRSSQRYDNIIKAAGDGFEPQFKDMDEDQFYIMGCSIILISYYKYNVDFRRPFYYSIPNANGAMHYYRVLYNVDFIEVVKTDKAKDITEKDLEELLDNFENIDLWKDKFPPSSWIFKGIVIANLFDVTADVSLSEFKENLLRFDKDTADFNESFEGIFRSIFNLPDIKIGYTDYYQEEDAFESSPVQGINSYMLNNKRSISCKSVLCCDSQQRLFDESKVLAISNVKKLYESDKEHFVYKNLMESNVNSAILAPIVHENRLLGIVEIVSPNVLDLNSINAEKLKDIMPFLVDSVVQAKEQSEDELELIIQQECTAIHPSVSWKFKQEARRFVRERTEGNQVAFREIIFEDVYPLFGQIDIKGSSEARNLAVRKDLILQLEAITTILDEIINVEPLPIYEQVKFRIDGFISIVENELHVDSEQKILDFVKKDIVPLFKFAKNKNSKLKKLISEYNKSLDATIKVIYNYRKAYDESVMMINKRMAALLDQKQESAQAMYPHYFERFKTDGVEHNMYIGESITQEESFNKVYLHNLRLWQLQVMCEMENEYYQLKKDLPVALDVASMVLVFNASLSVRFRMDEKRFDVDGTYNARYEVVKKRVDKAYIKGTKRRITEKGKLVIVYSQDSDEQEYLRYIKFLQSKNYLQPQVEIVALENLQGVTGLKAMRVNILYNKSKEDKEYYTYEDLMKSLDLG